MDNPVELEKVLASTKMKRKSFPKPRNSVGNTPVVSPGTTIANKKSITTSKTGSSSSKSPSSAKKQEKRKARISKGLNSSKTSMAAVENGKTKQNDTETEPRNTPKRKSTNQIG